MLRSSVRRRPARPPGDDRDLVVAETLEAALDAVRSGVPQHRIWAYLLPGQRYAMAEPSHWAEKLRSKAVRVGGLLTDSEEARDAVDRLMAPHRLHTVALPPLVADRRCPDCADVPLQADPPVPSDNPVEVSGQLAHWRWLLRASHANRPVTVPWSYVASRLLGAYGPWEPDRRTGWGGTPAKVDPRIPVPVSGWTAGDATRAAAALLDAADAPDGAGGHATSAPLRVVISGFDLKFVRELAVRAGRSPDLDVTLDEWPDPATRSEATETLVTGADVLVAEWARPNAVWLSQIKRPDQRLIVRIHRFEIDTTYPAGIDIAAVDTVVYVAPHMRQRIVDVLGWPAEKLAYVPNLLDLDAVDRPKYDGARFTLGLVGAVPSRKRLDLALDLLARLRGRDPRFTMLVRTPMPWTATFTWRNASERRYWHRCFQRLEVEPLLRGAVSFDPVGPDMGAWYRRIGHVVSVSDDESFHIGLCEGMASGAVPVIRPWEGADLLYDRRWVHASLDQAAAAVLACADAATWDAWAADARAEVRERYPAERVVAAWTALLRGDVRAAAGHFAVDRPAGE